MSTATSLTNGRGETGPVTATLASRAEPTAAAPTTSCGVADEANTSGRGKQSIVPPDVKGWNWGAFLACVPWGLGNRVWLVLLALIPWPLPGFTALVLAVVMGVKGSELAWRNKRWAGVEQFRAVQRKWAVAGVVLNVVTIAIMAMWPEAFFTP